MFKDLKVGDIVFDYTLQDFGEVVINNIESSYPITVKFKTVGDLRRYYTTEGYNYLNDNAPVLFYDRVPLIVPPKKPLPKLEVDTKVIVWNDYYGSDTKYNRYFSHFTKEGKICCFNAGATSWSSKNKTDTILWDNWELLKQGYT